VQRGESGSLDPDTLRAIERYWFDETLEHQFREHYFPKRSRSKFART